MNSTGHYRRMLCAAGAAGLVLTLTGCSEKSEVPVKPVALGAHERCALCGMVITNYEGPKAELFLKGVAEPVKFCSGRDAFTFALQPENARRLTGFFVQSADTDPKAPVTAESFLDARKAFFVVDGRFEGVMGAEPAAFADKTAAEKFIQAWGGRIVRFEEVTLEAL